MRTLAGHAGDVMSVAFSPPSPPDGKLLASEPLDKTVELWTALEGDWGGGEGRLAALDSLM